MQNASSAAKLQDAVNELNDQARWGRMDLAVQRVHPAYKTDFVNIRGRWGREIQIADADIQGIQVDDEKENAVSVLTVRWYTLETMQVHDSVVRQHWRKAEGNYLLESEQVVHGSKELLKIKRLDEEADAS